MDEKNENILKLNNQKEETKNNLNLLLQKINKIITDNYDILNKENPSPELLFDLHKEAEFKLKELKISKKINESTKKQYDTINKKNQSKLKLKIGLKENLYLLYS